VLNKQTNGNEWMETRKKKIHRIKYKQKRVRKD
jgi:hypothetical protein